MKILAPHANTSFPNIKRVLVVCMPTYLNPRWERSLAGKRIDEIDFYSLKFARQVLISPSFVQFSRSNPRTTEYMLHLAANFLHDHVANAEVELLLDSNSSQRLPEGLHADVQKVWSAEQEGLWNLNPELRSKLQARHFDTVLLMFPDAIGLGWSSIERYLFALKARNYVVFNGRQRVFVLDKETHRKLLWRRLIERSWLVEVSLGIGMAAISIPLAIYDLTWRNWKRRRVQL